jgi:acylphosphatase
MAQARLHAWVAGRVQGVGFRYWTRQVAGELRLRGFARNLDDGRVEVVAEGARDACEALLRALEGPGTPGRVRDLTHSWGEPAGEPDGFRLA